MPVTPGLQLPYGIQPVNAVPVDSYSGPFTGSSDTVPSAITAANSGIPSALRFKSMEVRLLVEGKSRKFWYKDGVADTDLVEFIGGTGGYTGTDTYFYVTGSTGGVSGSLFGGDLTASGSIKALSGFSGSLTRLSDGTSFMVAGSNITIASSSNGAITISSTGGGSSGPLLFTDPAAGKINSTGSLALAGDFGSSYTTTTAGSDVFFYVSGSKGTITTKPTSGMSVFGGDALISGSAFFDGTAGYALINQSNSGEFSLRNRTLGGTFVSSVNTSAGNTVNFLEVRPNGAATGSVASIFPGLYAGPANPFLSTDTTFFISGKRGAKNGITRGAVVFGGDVVTSGSAYLGTDTSDTVVVNGLLASDIIPDGNRTRNLGSEAARFANIYTGDLHLRNERGDYTLIEEEDCLTIRFNKNGKRYRFVLEPAPEFDEKL